MVILHADLTDSDDPSAANLKSMFMADYEGYGFTGPASADDPDGGDDEADEAVTDEESAVEDEPVVEDEPDQEEAAAAESDSAVDDSADNSANNEESPEETADDPPIDEQPPTEEEAAPEPTQICGYWYEALWGHFEIYGKDFDPELFQEGVGLKKELKGKNQTTQPPDSNSNSQNRLLMLPH